MAGILKPDNSPRAAAVTVALNSLVMAAIASAAWVPVLRYPPGAIIRPMLPVMVTGFVLFGAARLLWELVRWPGARWSVRLAMALMPLLAAAIAIGWPVGITAVLGLDMSG